MVIFQRVIKYKLAPLLRQLKKPYLASLVITPLISVIVIIVFWFFNLFLTGDINSHRYWTSAAFQGISTLFAFILSASLITFQLATQVYTHRISRGFLLSKSLWATVSFGVVALLILLLIQAAINYKKPSHSLLVFTLLISACCLISLPFMLRSTITALLPENVLKYFSQRITSDLLDRFSKESIVGVNNPVFDIESLTVTFLKKDDFSLAIVSALELLKELRPQ